MLTLFERETILLGSILKFEYDAASLIWPKLSADKLIFSQTGQIGGKDHSYIYAGIEYCMATKMSPSITNVLDFLGNRHGDMRPYVVSLVDRLSGYYRIHSLDPNSLIHTAELVDQAGVVYKTLVYEKQLTRLLDNPSEFQQYVDEIEDVDDWLNTYTSGLRGSVQNGPEGYKLAGDIAGTVVDELDQIKSGQVSLLLPIGLPSLSKANLVPYGNLLVLHGMSNSGKTSLMLELALGTAIGLGKHNISGCVAINSLETPANVVIRNMASMLSGFNTQKLYQGSSALQGQDYSDFLKAIDYIGTLPIYVDDTNLIKTSVMEYRLNGIHGSDRGPVRYLGTDYSELFSDDEGDSKEQNLTAVIRKHLQISRETNAAVVAISQSTYGIDGNNKARIAGAGGLRYSQGLRHAADIVLEVVNYPEMKKKGIDYRAPEGLDDDYLWILVEKTRGFGTPEPIRMIWEGESTRMLDPNLTYGRSSDVVFDHFIEKETVKPIVPEVSVSSNGHGGDWSLGLEGSF